MGKRKQWFINRWGKQNNVWYIDVQGVDQNGRTVWLSGNTLTPDQFGFGGFRDYQSTMKIINHFEKIVNITSDAYKYCSEDGVTSFTPQKVYLGFAPMKGENQIWPERELVIAFKLNEAQKRAYLEIFDEDYELEYLRQKFNSTWEIIFDPCPTDLDYALIIDGLEEDRLFPDFVNELREVK